jgi:pimeloyl-ACP methyl ester carboxylesterase
MRTKSILTALVSALLAACAVQAKQDDGDDRFPTSSHYGPEVMTHASFTAGVPEQWRINTLTTAAHPDATWKIVVITGTPSWSEFWAPTIAALPPTREMVVADRPGFAGSEPQEAVRDIAKQAEALSPMLNTRPGEHVLLVGQSFGAPVATLMAARYPDRVQALLLVSAYFGDRGPTARRMFGLGRVVQPFLGRDLKNSITEVSAQPAQLPAVWAALHGLQQPVVFIHGDADTFVPIQADQRIASEYGHTLVTVPGGDHFLNACCVPGLVQAMEQAISEAEGRSAAHPPAIQPPDPDPTGGPAIRR